MPEDETNEAADATQVEVDDYDGLPSEEVGDSLDLHEPEDVAIPSEEPGPDETGTEEPSGDQEKAEPPAAPEPTAPQFDAELFSMGRELGVSEDALLALGSAEKAVEYLYVLNERVERRQATEEPKPESKPKAPDRYFDAETHGEEWAKYEDHVTKELGELRQRVDQQTERAKHFEVAQQQAQAQAFLQQFDGILTGMGEITEFIGEGPANTFAADSTEMAARNDVLNEVLLVAAGYQATNQPVPPVEELVSRAVQVKLGEQIRAKTEEKVTREIGGRLRNRKGQFSPRPSQRDSVADDGKSPTARAIARVRQKMKDAGADPDGND